MGKKPDGKKKKLRYCFDNFKTARAECRERAMKNGVYGWPLCWEPAVGYYCPKADTGLRDGVAIATVEKSGALTNVYKEDAEFHRLKSYTNSVWWEQHIKTFPVPQWKKGRVRE
jgi:hypothetical protein